MNAQAARISTFSENIANSDTVGYKAATAQFETLLINQSTDSYTSGGVNTLIRYGIDQQGVLTGTNSPTDLAVQGKGFFVVADQSGNPFLTRAGSFVPDASGYLVNSAGFRLMGAPAGGGASGASSSGFAGLSPIQINTTGLVASASTQGVFTANLPTSATQVASANLPSANAATATPSEKTSLVAYDSLGDKVTLDIYLTKTGDNAWEAAVFDSSKAGTAGGFPYGAGPLDVTKLQFDPSSGALTTPNPGKISVAVPGGNTMTLNIGGMTQLGAAYSVSQASVDGSAPSQFSQLKVGADGSLSAVYQNGVATPQYSIELATVPSIDNLTPLSGNVYDVTQASGGVMVGQAGQAGLGSIVSSSLESSTVDVASELTGMIETQRSYEANSKAFQVASNVTDVLVNLKV